MKPLILSSMLLLSLVGCSDLKSPETRNPETESYTEPSRPIDTASKDAYEEDDTQSTAKQIAVGSSQEHNFFDDTTDWYKVSVERGKTYTFETSVAGYCDTILDLYKGSTKIASHNDKSRTDYGSKIEYTALETTDLTVKVSSYMYRSGKNRPYTIAFNEAMQVNPDEPSEKKEWTLMVYLDGDNNLDMSSTFDVSEMCSAIQLPEDTKTFNVAVLWDNSKGTKNGYYVIEAGEAKLKKDIGEPNMGNPQTAKNFIEWSSRIYPADKYMFIFWNHGGGMDRSRGVCWDDTNNGDHLSEVEQLDILEYGNKCIGKKWDIVGYDACLMACGELFYQLRNVSDYMIASQENEPGGGWDYRFLNLLRTTPGTTPAQLSTAIAQSYANYYKKRDTETMSVGDLSKVNELALSLDAFCKEAMLASNGTIYGELAKYLPKFGDTVSKDLVSYMKNIISSTNTVITPEVKIKAQAVIDSVNNMLIFEWHGASWNGKAHGVSMIMKTDSTVYSLLSLSKDTQWDEFCDFAKFPYM